MSVLAEILSSRVRAGIFQLLFGLNDVEFHVRELARRSGFHEATVRQELRKLKRLGLLSERRDGNRVYYRANRTHPIFPEVRRVVLKTSGLVEVLGESLKGADITVAFVFGSVAQAKETAQSDIDLMVVGTIGLRKLAALLSGISERVGREINPHVMKKAEYQRRLQAGDHFVTQVLDGPKLFVIGTQDDLEAMAR